MLDRWQARGVNVDGASVQQRLGELPTLDGQLDVTNGSRACARCLRSSLPSVEPRSSFNITTAELPGDRRASQRVAAHGEEVPGSGARSLQASNGASRSELVTPSEEQVRAAVAQQAGTWFIANRSESLEQAERAAFVAWLKASPIHVEEYLGVAFIAHDLPAAAEDPQEPLESLIALARADDRRGRVARGIVAGARLRAEAHTRAAHLVIGHVDCCHGAAAGRIGAVVDARR